VFVVIIAFIIWAVGWGGWNRQDRETAANEPAGVERNAAPGGLSQEQGEIDSIDSIVEAENKQALVNRNVRLEDVALEAKAGERAFWVGEEPERRVLVVLSEAAPLGNEAEQLPQSGELPGEEPAPAAKGLQPGEEVTIIGKMQQVSAPQELESRYGIDESDVKQLQAGEVFILAQQVTPKGEQ
jgi:hypothetical protein